MNYPHWVFLVLFITFFLPVPATESFILRYSGAGRFYQVERANLSKFVNNRYTGLTHRETRALIYPTQRSEGTVYTGEFFVFEETLRDMVAVARQVEEIRPVSFTISNKGEMHFLEDTGYPRMRSFPTFPYEPVVVGQRWQAEAERVIDPLNTGVLTYLPIYVEYQFIGPEMYRNIPVYRIKAKYAIRYDQTRRRRVADPSLLRATGTHDVDILVSRETGTPLLIVTRMDETFFYADGTSVRFRGNSAVFSETPVPVDREIILPALDNLIARANPPAGTVPAPVPYTEDALGLENGLVGQDIPPTAQPQIPPSAPTQQGQAHVDRPQTDPKSRARAFDVEKTNRGIRLSVRDIRFVPDSDEILPSEMWRIEAIVEALKLMGDSQFLVEGHTAGIGRPAGEMELSVKRAQRITDELVKQGIRSGRIIFIGHGGTRPIGDNATSVGRALNRRVEITVLE